MLTNEERRLLSTLEEWWECSDYNENTDYELNFYMQEKKCNIGDTAYLYDYHEDELIKLEIIHIIRRSDNMEYYDELIEDDDVLLDGEKRYDADTSAEFITDDECYLVWFKYAK